ncbi:MAG: hypothetical protein LC754_07400, partial [Acidobacteria bacterium]|nr:hypothetical protein [Acidobacteriota bacterium]
TTRPDDPPAPFHASSAAVEPGANRDAADAVALRASESNGARDATLTLPQMAAAEATQSAPRQGRKVGWLAVSVALALALVGLGVVIARLFLSSPPMPPSSAIKLSRLMVG